MKSQKDLSSDVLSPEQMQVLKNKGVEADNLIAAYYKLYVNYQYINLIDEHEV